MKEYNNPTKSISDFNDIATAPGDLAAPAVAERLRSMHYQLRHENTIEPALPRPDEPVRVEARAGTGVNLRSAEIRFTTDRSLPGPESPCIPMRPEGVECVPFGGYVERWVGEIPGTPAGTTVRYRITGHTAESGTLEAQDGQGFWFRYPGDLSTTVFAYRVMPPDRQPSWLEDAVIYQIFVDRFRRGEGDLPLGRPREKHGGELAGVTRSLSYLSRLGVNCLWLSPIGPAPSYHRYDSTDFFGVDPDIGGIQALDELTAAAHERGMKVILDFVPSHLSIEHPAFAEARTKADSPKRDWFVFYDWPESYRSFLEAVPDLPSFNTQSEGARRYLIESACSWMKHGIDGFRLDHVIGHGMDFWAEFQNALEEINPEAVTIGEATDTPDALRRYQNRMTSVLDFPLARALRLTFGTGDWSLGELDRFLTLHERYMKNGPILTGFLDNHDMDRFLHVASQNRDSLQMAALCLFTLPAPPVIYYGTEVGMSHDRSISDSERGGDALVRADMLWNESEWDGELLEFFRALIAFRRSHLDFVRGGRRCIHLDSPGGVYACELTHQAERLVLVFNLSSAARSIEAKAEEVVFTAGADASSITGGERIEIGGRSAGVLR